MRISGKYMLAPVLFAGFILTAGCSRNNDGVPVAGNHPVIEPDYIGVTVPPNIAPMNFIIKGGNGPFIIVASSGITGTEIKVKSRSGKVIFPENAWKKMVSGSRGGDLKIEISAKASGNKRESYLPFNMKVAEDPADPWIAYRLIHPGYYSWSNIRIMQRSVESFAEEPLFENRIMEKNCANCHSFNMNNPDRFMIHIRGSMGGTYIVENEKITRTDPKIDAMPGGATYPSWHPGGRFIAFSSNQVRQSFYSIPQKSIEVFDLVSSLVLYDREKNETLMVNDGDTANYQLTFPSWSPDGKYLYFCRAHQEISADDPQLEQILGTHYDLARKEFNAETRTFGNTEIMINASDENKSVSFPRISPDGRFLVYTLADYGTFPIWHREADLYLLDLQSGERKKMDVNSDETESYHSWSSNSKWLVFSSKRIDGRSARPHFAYINPDGSQGKEFVLPQKDPSLYERMLESFNIPEFVTGKISTGPRDFAVAAKQVTLVAKPGDPSLKPADGNNLQLRPNERSIHE